MIALTYLLLLLLKLISAQRLSIKGERLSLRPYYNVAPKPGPGVGVLQDLSNARILSNEPFIISFEFPRMEKSGNSRKSKFGAKRSRTQRKRNRRLRQFRQVLIPEGDFLERTKRYQTFQKHPFGEPDFKSTNLMIAEAKARSLQRKFHNGGLYDGFAFRPFQKFEGEETTSRPANEFQKGILQQIINAKKEDNASEENIEANNHKQWERIKGEWMSLFPKAKEPSNDVDEEQARLKEKSQKMWANCQLLKLLKAPQRNPYFYKLLPPNYSALVMNEEKQLQCNKVYDIIDLSKDKKMISEKIEQLEKILGSDYEDGAKLPIPLRMGEEPKMRKRRDVQDVEKKQEEQNTLQDESLQGKTEGEGRTDRNRRTKERQNKRKRNRTRAGKAKSKKQKESPAQAEGEKQTENEQPPNETAAVERKADEGQKMSGANPKILRLAEGDIKLETHGHEPEVKKEREIKQGTTLQDVFNPTEINKVIKQKELEANIFDKVVRAMKKYEENNPYDESFVPKKRESRNETVEVPEKADSGESILEVDDAVRKLAKIFKILGVKSEAKKCANCDASEESSYEEDGGKKLKTDMVRAGKQSGKCTCDDDCPVCHNCLRCFKECKKNMVGVRNRQTPAITPYTSEYAGPTTTSKNVHSNRGLIMAEPPKDDTEPGLTNQPKAEMMYRSKLPPSRDFVKVYFDNPDNKLLVWTKRGRRTMPWGPLTSDLQLYRDRARQILKSAEDILQRIKETEDKIHGSPQLDENDQEAPPVKSENEKNMDDIIKKVVNEDTMQKFLTTPWKDRVEATEDTKKLVDYMISKGVHLDKEEQESNGKEDPNITNKEYGQVPRPDAESLLKGEKNEKPHKETLYIENDDKALEKRLNSVSETDLESVEAAVHPIEGSQEKTVNTLHGDADTVRNNKEVGEQDDYEDIPAKVEAVSDKNMFKIEAQDDSSERVSPKNKDFSPKNRVEEAKVKKVYSEEPEEEKEPKVKKVYREESEEEEEPKVKKVYREESEEEEAKVEKALSEESEEEEAKVEKALSEESEEEEPKVKKAYSEESEEDEAKVEKAISEESEEEAKVGKAISEESEEEEPKVKKVYREESEEEEAKVEKAISEESEEEAKVEKAISEESEEEAKVGKAISEESEEEEAKVEKALSEESEEEPKIKKVYREESEEEKPKVKKVYREESEEEEAKVGKAISEESEEEEAKVEKALSEESEEEEPKIKKVYREESEEEKPKVKKVYSEESEESEEEEAKVKRVYSKESEEEEEPRTKALGEESEEEALDSKKNNDNFSIREIVKQLRKAVEKHKEMQREQNEEVNRYHVVTEHKVEGKRKNLDHREELTVDRNNISDENEPVEMKKNLSDDREELKERENGKYNSNDDSDVIERINANSDEDKDIGEIENGKYDSDEDGSVGEGRHGKYGSDDADLGERENENYDNDDDSDIIESKNTHSDENKDIGEIKNGYINRDENIEEQKNSNNNSDDEVLKEIREDMKKEEKVKAVDVEAKSPADHETQNTNAMRAKSTDSKHEYKSDKVGNQNIYEDHIKPLEEDYIIKGVKQTKEEKDAIIKALLNAEEKNEEKLPQEETTESFYYYTHPTEMSQITTKPPEHVTGDGLETLVQHIQGGYMNEDDIKAVKKLDESKIVNLVAEMQKNDKQKATIDCKKEIELCKIACGCNETNSTTTEVDKYDIMKGFLRWLKTVQLDHMVPISV